MNSQKGRQPKPWLEIIKGWKRVIKDWRSSRIGDHQGLEIRIGHVLSSSSSREQQRTVNNGNIGCLVP